MDGNHNYDHDETTYQETSTQADRYLRRTKTVRTKPRGSAPWLWVVGFATIFATMAAFLIR